MASLTRLLLFLLQSLPLPAMACKFMEFRAGPQGQTIFQRYGFTTAFQSAR